MPRFTLIGTASTEFTTTADTAEEAVRDWHCFLREHAGARLQNMRVRFLHDQPIALDSNGQPCEFEGDNKRWNTPWQTTASS